ncbi:hypothetical protein [Streptomyces sp. NPDC088925]|uniref:hypothetical protein n=1 Tax=Streptomyces sp. NPDC088925 TaxID=3365914 RepID=UPI0037FF33DA
MPAWTEPRRPDPKNIQQQMHEKKVLGKVLGPDAATYRVEYPYDGLTRSQILAALWNNARPWLGAPGMHGAAEPVGADMTLDEAEEILASIREAGFGQRKWLAVKELRQRTLVLRFTAEHWEAPGYDLYQDSEGLLDRVITTLRETGSAARLPES